MNRFESIGDRWQGAPDDHTHRIVEVRPLHLGLNLDRLDPAVRAVIDGRFVVVSSATSLSVPSLRAVCASSHVSVEECAYSSPSDVEESHVLGISLDELGDVIPRLAHEH